MKPKLNVVNLGKMNYLEAYKLQLNLLEKRYHDEIKDTLHYYW